MTMSTGCGRSAAVERARVDAFADEDARIAAKPPVQLIAADIDRDDVSGAALQQHVGEASCRCADVERRAPGDLDGEGVERVRELHAASTDIRVIGLRRARRALLCDRAPALKTTWPSTLTCRARINARARSRDGARPRSTSATSNLVLVASPDSACETLARLVSASRET